MAPTPVAPAALDAFTRICAVAGGPAARGRSLATPPWSRCWISLPQSAPRHAAPPSGARSERQEGEALLASFTAPADLVPADERHAEAPWLARWLAGMQDAADASELWAPRRGLLRLETSTVCCRVAL